jgi:hypothetical protein
VPNVIATNDKGEVVLVTVPDGEVTRIFSPDPDLAKLDGQDIPLRYTVESNDKISVTGEKMVAPTDKGYPIAVREMYMRLGLNAELSQ